ncbi:MAG: NADH-quinone oxidoreductase subunit C [Planctomycetes bacterium]|nr:NADH-quinone oxidoreductase subunit C [Planctomycetota bacterium]
MSEQGAFGAVRNGVRIKRSDIPELTFDRFRQAVLDAVTGGDRVSAMFGHASGSNGVEIYAVLADDSSGWLCVAKSRVQADSFPSLTPDCPQVHLFEREIAEQFDVQPEGHPWLKPVRFHKPERRGASVFNGSPTLARSASEGPAGEGPVVGMTDFYRLAGDEIHEVAVGPVHAGVIEPGHFRFQCHGEHVFHLEISLGYQHRGVERVLVGGPNKRTIHIMETLAGDTTIGHATAYCQVVESLAGCSVPARAEWLRGIALELERLANHTGDLGALANDVGFLPTASYCGRLRGDFLNATALLCGSRFGRGTVRPGGVGFDSDGLRTAELQKRLEAAIKDVANPVTLLWDSSSVMARFEETGRVARDVCESLGLVGPAARACGVERDVRHQFPSGIFRFAQVPISTVETGDVFARAYVRWLEIQRSAAFILDQLKSAPSGSVRQPVGAIAPNHFVATLVEGWRGEICHAAMTDESGRFCRYKVVDPSFHNWTGLAMALRDQQISDFPLCNKSFNLSYCGFDL